MTGEAICKGSWSIGNNCGQCAQCIETASEGVEKIRELSAELCQYRRRVQKPNAGEDFIVPRARAVEEITADLRAVAEEADALLTEAAQNRIVVEIDYGSRGTLNGVPHYRMRVARLSKVL